MLDVTVTSIEGQEVDLKDYRGKALLVVNTAFECGYTRQYKGLQELHDRYAARGFAVLGFPCNDFGAQEPGEESEILAFCEKNYGVTFPLFSRVQIKGSEPHPLYAYLTEETAEGIRGEVRWNFTKFLVSPTGEVVARFEPKVEPGSEELTGAIEAQLP